MDHVRIASVAMRGRSGLRVDSRLSLLHLGYKPHYSREFLRPTDAVDPPQSCRNMTDLPPQPKHEHIGNFKT